MVRRLFLARLSDSCAAVCARDRANLPNSTCAQQCGCLCLRLVDRLGTASVGVRWIPGQISSLRIVMLGLVRTFLGWDGRGHWAAYSTALGHGTLLSSGV